MASKINVTNSNNMTMKQIMQVWKNSSFASAKHDSSCVSHEGSDFNINKFNEFVFDKYGIDIVSDSTIFNLSEFYDMDPNVKDRKTIKDVFKPKQTSLNQMQNTNHNVHKLKCREEKRDRTKKPDAKRASRVHKKSLKIKFDREI